MKKREMGRCLGYWVGRNGWEIGDREERSR